MEAFCRKSLSETIDTAIDYSSKLEDLIVSITKAQQQIKSTAHESASEIDNVFDEIGKSVQVAIEQRRTVLKERVRRIESKSLAPLNACQDIIVQKLKNTQTLICEGQDLLDQLRNKKVPLDIKSNTQFLDQASFLGSLPAVPNLDEVPALTFHCNVDAVKDVLIKGISETGLVSCMGPVQLTNVEEKPGGLLVHWEEVETDRPVDIQSFKLQVALGSYPDANQNHTVAKYGDVYEGLDTFYLVRDLRTNQPYTLRVCCQDSGSKSWSAWSLPKVAVTYIPPFVWDCSNPNYVTSVEGKIACKKNNEKSVLLSSLPLGGTNHSIEFLVLESGRSAEWGDGLGLAKDSTDVSDMIQPGVLFLNAKGHVFLDGKEKTTRLPPLTKGCRVSFTCEYMKQQNRLRVNIDSEDKAVTYDWILPAPSIHFVMSFNHPGWKILVE